STASPLFQWDDIQKEEVPKASEKELLNLLVLLPAESVQNLFKADAVGGRGIKGFGNQDTFLDKSGRLPDGSLKGDTVDRICGKDRRENVTGSAAFPSYSEKTQDL